MLTHKGKNVHWDIGISLHVLYRKWRVSLKPSFWLGEDQVHIKEFCAVLIYRPFYGLASIPSHPPLPALGINPQCILKLENVSKQQQNASIYWASTVVTLSNVISLSHYSDSYHVISSYAYIKNKDIETQRD